MEDKKAKEDKERVKMLGKGMARKAGEAIMKKKSKEEKMIEEYSGKKPRTRYA